METALSKLTHTHQSLPLSLHHRRPSISPSIYSISFRFPSLPRFSKSAILSPQPIRALSSSNLPQPRLPIRKPEAVQTPNSYPFSLLRTTAVAVVTAAALVFAGFNLNPVIAAPISAPETVEEVISEEEKEKKLEEYLSSQPDDVDALRTLMEIKIKSKKVKEATEIIDHLIKLDPEDIEWPLLKSHMFCYSGDMEAAKKGFYEILSKDPLRVEAYHGLVMVASQDENSPELENVEKRIREGIELVKKKNKMGEVRDFRLLLAQVQVFQGEFTDALGIYEDLVKEEPRDFRPYLCQGIIFTLMGKKDEAEKNFEKYRRLVPEGHPYAKYFDDNLNATKLFSQKVENERRRATA